MAPTFMLPVSPLEQLICGGWRLETENDYSFLLKSPTARLEFNSNGVDAADLILTVLSKPVVMVYGVVSLDMREFGVRGVYILSMPPEDDDCEVLAEMERRKHKITLEDVAGNQEIYGQLKAFEAASEAAQIERYNAIGVPENDEYMNSAAHLLESAAYWSKLAGHYAVWKRIYEPTTIQRLADKFFKQNRPR